MAVFLRSGNRQAPVPSSGWHVLGPDIRQPRFQTQNDERGHREGAQGENGSEGGPDSKSGAESSTSAPPPERPEVQDWVSEDDTERPPASPGDEGVEQNASAYLKAQGLADSTPVEFQRAPDRTAPASKERASRWGEEAQTLLDDPDPAINPSRRRTALPPASDRSGAQAPTNSLTRDELRRVQGVTGEDVTAEDAFSDFDVGANTSPARREDSEERPEDGDERGEASNPDDDGRP